MAERHRKFQMKQAVRGQELVEFALLLPVVILILFGVLDLGRAFFAAISIANAAREGARYGIKTLDESAGTVDSAGITNFTINEAAGVDIFLTDANIRISCPPSSVATGCARFHPLRVEVEFLFQLILGELPFINLPEVTIVRAAEMMIP